MSYLTYTQLLGEWTCKLNEYRDRISLINQQKHEDTITKLYALGKPKIASEVNEVFLYCKHIRDSTTINLLPLEGSISSDLFNHFIHLLASGQWRPY